jgi:hypothetical protein
MWKEGAMRLFEIQRETRGPTYGSPTGRYTMTDPR